MKGKLPDEHQKKAIEALSILSDLLTEEGIPFFLLAGTTLGAVREGGMIPWDDDIDVGVFYEDEEKVAKLLQEKLPEGFSWIDRHVDRNYAKLHGKIVYDGSGVLDIFPLVRVSDNEFLRKLQWAERKVISKLLKAKKPGSNYIDRHSPHVAREKAKVFFANLLSVFFSVSFLEKWAHRNASRYLGQKSQWYVNMYSIYSLYKEMIKSKWLENPSMVEFEGGSYPTVGDTDSYLRKLYGDYMTPPPEHNRASHHDSVY